MLQAVAAEVHELLMQLCLSVDHRRFVPLELKLLVIETENKICSMYIAMCAEGGINWNCTEYT